MKETPDYSCWYKLIHAAIFSDKNFKCTVKLMLGPVKFACSKFQNNMQCNYALIVEDQAL